MIKTYQKVTVSYSPLNKGGRGDLEIYSLKENVSALLNKGAADQCVLINTLKTGALSVLWVKM